ncbi:MAG: beta-lactamase family protein, partial [Candidatus Adiutrix sp.]|nr:beta-lactamase family protein [Candidatus Adiutrix sp.]
MSSEPFTRAAVEALLEHGVTAGAFPGAVALWGDPASPPQMVCAGRCGRTRNLEPVTPALIYDLASLTKVLSATSLAMILCQRGSLDIRQPLASGPLRGLAPLPPNPSAD